jgi:carbamoylphosphate synthase small subunit
MSTELHNTLMGKRLIEGTLPDIAHQLKRIADSLEKLTESKSVSVGIDDIDTEYLTRMLKEENEYASSLGLDVKPKVKGEGTAQSVLDYVERNGSATHKEMQEYYKSLNGSNTFAYCLKNLLIPYKNRNTKRYLIKNDIGKYEVRLANPSNWVVKEY